MVHTFHLNSPTLKIFVQVYKKSTSCICKIIKFTNLTRHHLYFKTYKIKVRRLIYIENADKRLHIH